MNVIFFKKLLLFILAIGISLVAIYFVPLPSANPMTVIINKKEILINSNRFHKPRMIFLGGSSVLVGIDCELIEKQLPFYPVNMGVNAGFSIQFLFDLIKNDIKAGDIIVLSPDIGTLADYSNHSKEARKWCLVANRNFALKNLYQFPSQIPDFAMDIFEVCEWKVYGFCEAIIKRRKHIFHNGNVQFEQRQNRFGDGDETLFATESSSKLRETDGPLPLLKDSSFSNDFHEFASSIKSKGARLYFVYGPYSRYAYVNNYDKIEKINAILHSSANYPILGTQEEYAYDDSCFTNSAYHLRSAIRTQRTLNLINEIKPYLVKNKAENY